MTTKDTIIENITKYAKGILKIIEIIAVTIEEVILSHNALNIRLLINACITFLNMPSAAIY